MKTDIKLISTSILTAFAASLCCITPLLALIAGTSGLAAAFSWLEPLRPYLVGLTAAVLGFAWYQKLAPKASRQPKAEADCCTVEERKPFMQSKTFLAIVTLFAMALLAFPLYSKVFYPESNKKSAVAAGQSKEQIEISIKGMTCAGCEQHVEHEINQLAGIVSVKASHEKANAVVEFDNSRTSIEELKSAIARTGYEVVEVK